MEPIRILHASDLHIARIAKLKSITTLKSLFKSPRKFFNGVNRVRWANTYDPTVLRAFVDFISRTPDIDALLFTGDLATTGDFDDLAMAFRFFKDHDSAPWLYGPVKAFSDPCLAGIELPVWLLPGNHDRFSKSGPGVFVPGGKEFHNVFSDYWNDDVKVYPKLTTKSGLTSIVIVAADFSLRSADDCGSWLNRYGGGKVYQDILDKLELETRLLTDAEHPGLTVFWAIHFPPAYPKLSRPMRLIDCEAVLSAASRCGVRAIMSGHTHVPRRYTTTGTNIEVFCAGTATEYDPNTSHHFQIVNIYDHSKIRIDHYGLDQSGGFTLARSD
jgi:predicted phosphodiesterase